MKKDIKHKRKLIIEQFCKKRQELFEKEKPLKSARRFGQMVYGYDLPEIHTPVATDIPSGITIGEQRVRSGNTRPVVTSNSYSDNGYARWITASSARSSYIDWATSTNDYVSASDYNDDVPTFTRNLDTVTVGYSASESVDNITETNER